MICSQCGVNNSDEAIFCQKCGKQLETTGQHEFTLLSPPPLTASPYENFSYPIPNSPERKTPPPPPYMPYKGASAQYEPRPPLRSHSNRGYLIVIAVLVAILLSAGFFELGQLLKRNSQGNTNTTTPTAIPSSNPSPPAISHFILNANQGFPGTDTGVNLLSGDQLTIKASGQVTYGATGPSYCYGKPTNPDGVSLVNGGPCRVTFGDSVYPPAPVGTLLARIGQVGTISATGWFVVGSSFSSTVVVGGELYLIYNDSIYGDNIGSYQVTITVEHG